MRRTASSRWPESMRRGTRAWIWEISSLVRASEGLRGGAIDDDERARDRARARRSTAAIAALICFLRDGEILNQSLSFIYHNL